MSSYLAKKHRPTDLAVFAITVLIKTYQVIVSPFLPRTCRFHPTCSEYCRQAFQKYGFKKGLVLALKRLSRCHPWNPGGFDPLP